MKIYDLHGCALALCACAAMLSACGGSQATVTATESLSVIPARARVHQPQGRSLMEPRASGQALLYVSDGVSKVYVYTYPRGRLEGTLTGFIYPGGECVDSAGDVFITASSDPSVSSSTIYEYAHGGTTPIATLNDPGVARGCAVDPTTGNLAVANTVDDSNPYGKYGDVAVYAEAQGSPTVYYSSQFYFRFCGYDNQGNLYLSASNGYYGNEAQLVGLASGSSYFEQIDLNTTLYTVSDFSPSVQWDGQHMTVSSDQYSKVQGREEPVLVYQLSIAGSSGTILGTTELACCSNKGKHTGQSWIQGNTIIAIYFYKARGYISLWPYPGGGMPRKSLRRGDKLWGVTVSSASSQ